MTTMIEKQINKAQKDIEKYTKSIVRNQGRLAKWTAKFEANPNDIEADINKDIAKDDLEEAKKNLAKAEANLEKLTGKAEAKAEQQAEADRISNMENTWWKVMKEELEKTPEQRKAEYEAWLKEFKAECLKDGIKIKDADARWISGTAANGERFAMYINDGWTERPRD